MNKSRLSALMQKHLGLESERPADAVEATETPAVVEETPAADVPAADAAPVEQTTDTVAETVEVPAVTEEPAAPAEEAPAAPAVAEEEFVAFHTKESAEEEVPAVEPAAEAPVVVEEPAAAPVEEVAAAPAEEVPAAEVPAEAVPAAEEPAAAEEVVATEGDGEEVIPQTPAEDAAQGEAEAAAAAAEVPAEEVPAAAEEVPAAIEEPVAAVSTEDGEARPAEETPAPAAEEPAPAAAEETSAEATEQPAEVPAEQVEEQAAEVVADATPAAEEPAAPVEEAPVETAPVEEVAAPAEEPAVVATEDEVPAAETPAADEVVAAAVDAAQTPDAADTFVGVVEAGGEADELVQSYEHLRTIAAGLESIAADLEASVQEGGLRPQAARMMNLAVESYTRQIGVTQRVTSSLESYGGMSQRIDATQASLEGVQEVAKQVVETIKQVAQAIWKAIVEFAKKIFAASTWVKEQAEKLTEKYKAAKGEAKSKEIKLSAATASRLAIDGKVGKVSKTLHDVVTVAFDTVEYDKAGLAAIEHEREALLEAIQKGDGKGAAEMFAKNDPVLPKVFNHADGDTHSTQELAGGVSFFVHKSTANVFGVDMTFYKAGKNKAEHAITEEVTLRTPDLHEIGEILEVCKMVVSVGEAVEGMAKDLEAEADKAFKGQYGSISDVSEAFKAGALVAAYRDRASQLNRASSMVMGHLVTTARASLSVVEQALNEYEYPEAA